VARVILAQQQQVSGASSSAVTATAGAVQGTKRKCGDTSNNDGSYNDDDDDSGGCEDGAADADAALLCADLISSLLNNVMISIHIYMNRNRPGGCAPPMPSSTPPARLLTHRRFPLLRPSALPPCLPAAAATSLRYASPSVCGVSPAATTRVYTRYITSAHSA